jgi:hypothetical protein
MPASAPTYNNYSSPVDTVTTQQFMRGEFENVKKYNPVLAALEARGNIKAEASGKSFERNARVGIYTSAARSDLAERNFARKQQRVVYAVPYAWYETTGALGDQDITYNSGKEALVKLNGVMVKNMGEDMRRQFSSRMVAAMRFSASLWPRPRRFPSMVFRPSLAWVALRLPLMVTAPLASRSAPRLSPLLTWKWPLISRTAASALTQPMPLLALMVS